MKKIIVLLLFVILVSGCSADYNLEISKDFKFKETLNVNIANNSFEITYDSFSEGIEETFDNINNYLEIPLNDYKLKRGLKYSDVKISNKYDDEISFLESPFLKNANARIENYKTESGNDVFQILIDYNFNDWLNTNKYSTIDVENMKLNITFPYEIISSNADKEKDNVLTWDLKTLKAQRSFYIEYNKDKLVKSNNMFIIIAIILVFICCLGAFLIVKKRKTNSI